MGKEEKERENKKVDILNVKLPKIYCSLFLNRDNKLSSNLLLLGGKLILDVLRDNIKLG